jgi:hypothetical protein
MHVPYNYIEEAFGTLHFAMALCHAGGLGRVCGRLSHPLPFAEYLFAWCKNRYYASKSNIYIYIYIYKYVYIYIYICCA